MKGLLLWVVMVATCCSCGIPAGEQSRIERECKSKQKMSVKIETSYGVVIDVACEE